MKALPADNAAFVATFAKGAALFVPNFSVNLDEPDTDICGQIAGMNPHASLASTKLTKLTTGGDRTFVWLAAEFDVVVVSREPGEKPGTERQEIRAVELLDAASDWKVVAASFTKVSKLVPRRDPGDPIALPTEPGPLTRLLASPDALAHALAHDPVVVYGTDANERAIGNAAGKTLLRKWHKLSLSIETATKVREVHTSSWSYSVAIVNLAQPSGPPERMSAFAIAVPTATGSSVVAVIYGAL
jgi:hypothetical protein